MTGTPPGAGATEDPPQQAPVIAVPTITIDGQHHPFTPAGDCAAYRGKFTGNTSTWSCRSATNLPQEDPYGHTQAVIDADHL